MRPADGNALLKDRDDVDPTFLNHHAWALRWQSRSQSVAMAEQVLEISRNSGVTRAHGARRRNGLALRTLAWQAVWRGDFDQSEDYAHRAVARLRDAGADIALAMSHVVLAELYSVRSRRDKARVELDTAFSLIDPEQYPDEMAELLVVSSSVERKSGRFDLAQARLTRAEKLAQGPIRAMIDLVHARALMDTESPADGLERAAAALENCDRYDNRLVRPYALAISAAALIDLRRLDEVASMLRAAQRLAQQDADYRADCIILHEITRLYCLQGRTPDALVLAKGGEKMAWALGYKQWQRRFLQRSARFHERLGQTDEALKDLKAYVALRESETD